MCGIVGLYLKNPEIRDRLGAYFSPMLEQMSDRGPDSAGVAIYRDDVSQSAKVTLYNFDLNFDWLKVAADATHDLGVDISVNRISAKSSPQSCAVGLRRKGRTSQL
jgi:glutamate synthase domain-containing protein 1